MSLKTGVFYNLLPGVKIIRFSSDFFMSDFSELIYSESIISSSVSFAQLLSNFNAKP